MRICHFTILGNIHITYGIAFTSLVLKCNIWKASHCVSVVIFKSSYTRKINEYITIRCYKFLHIENVLTYLSTYANMCMHLNGAYIYSGDSDKIKQLEKCWQSYFRLATIVKGSSITILHSLFCSAVTITGG